MRDFILSNKKFVLNADDFGLSLAHNCAVMEGYADGILKSASLMANGEAFDDAVLKVIPACKNLGVGVHLNIIEGSPLVGETDKLTGKDGKFNNSYVDLLRKSFQDKTFLEQVEKEFRAQIEKIRDAGVEITHLDSHVHIHSIPPIFELVCKLAKEYGIKQVRTQFEKPYIIPDVYIHMNCTYLLNLVKVFILDMFTVCNRKKIKKYGLFSNDYLIGVSYTSMMTNLAIYYGLNALKDKENIVAEALIHPCRYEEGLIDNHFTEYQITKNQKLKSRIEELGFEISNYKSQEKE